MLTRYGVERLLYRLSRTPAGERFILKGAALFYIWEGEIPRPTRDVDFLGSGDASPKAVAAVFREVCGATVEPDGLSVLASGVRDAQIRDRYMKHAPEAFLDEDAANVAAHLGGAKNAEAEARVGAARHALKQA